LKQELGQCQTELDNEQKRSKANESLMKKKDEEIVRLEKLSAELKAILQHGLAGLDVPRMTPVTELTKELLLGVSQYSEGGKGNGNPTDSDSAIEDPNTESLRSRVKSRQTKTVQKPLERLYTVPPPGIQQPLQTLNAQIVSSNRGISNSQQLYAPLQAKPLATSEMQKFIPSFHEPPVLNETQINSKVPPQILPPESTLVSQYLPPPHPISRPHSNLSSQYGPHTPPTKMTAQTPQSSPPSRPRSSTLINGSLDNSVDSFKPILENKEVQEHKIMKKAEQAPPPTFQPVPLDLSETMSATSVTEVDGIKGILGNVVTKLASQKPVPAGGRGGSLDDKVQSFLARLHQDSLNLSLDLPPTVGVLAPLQGPSLHLSLSTSDLGNTTLANTTLSEGKFIKGLETSIEVLAAEVSSSTSGS